MYLSIFLGFLFFVTLLMGTIGPVNFMLLERERPLQAGLVGTGLSVLLLFVFFSLSWTKWAILCLIALGLFNGAALLAAGFYKKRAMLLWLGGIGLVMAAAAYIFFARNL